MCYFFKLGREGLGRFDSRGLGVALAHRKLPIPLRSDSVSAGLFLSELRRDLG